ncbi:MAG: diol dehydratase small subunit [Pseudomonadota bacterium]
MAEKNADLGLSPELLAEAVKKVLSTLGQSLAGPGAASGPSDALTAKDYPLAAKRPDLVHSASGMKPADITLEKVISGQVVFDDIKTSPETLEYQARIAESVGRPRLANNLRRAAELTRIPDDRVLQIYNSLRPYRCTKQELLDIAAELESKYQARICATFVREAAAVYENNKRLKKS